MREFDVPCGSSWAAYVLDWTVEFEYRFERTGQRRGRRVRESILERMTAQLTKDDPRTRRGGQVIWSARSPTRARVEGQVTDSSSSAVTTAEASTLCGIEVSASPWRPKQNALGSLSVVFDPANSHYSVKTRVASEDGARTEQTTYPFHAAGPVGQVAVPSKPGPLELVRSERGSLDGVPYREKTSVRCRPGSLMAPRDRSALPSVEAAPLEDVDPIPLPLPVAVMPLTERPQRHTVITGEVMELARAVLTHPNILLADLHQSGDVDAATALRNVQQAAEGKECRRSRYRVEGAPAPPGPGGFTALRPEPLRLLLRLADRHLVRVTEVCGGATGESSTHYLGWSFDVDMIDGPLRRGGNWQRIEREAKRLGATACFGPGRLGHDAIAHFDTLPLDDPRFPWRG